VALGYLALHTTPESVHERQPLDDAEAGLVLVADARLDNRDALLRELTPRRVAGAGVRGAAIVTDAELILAAYRAWGEGCAERLLGDFAVAVWDGRKRSLFLARDVMGMRGLYYRIERGRVLFATEVKQILAAPGVDAEIFEPAVGAHLVAAYGPAEWTFWEGIAQVPPGHAVLVEGGSVRSRRYWEVDPGRRIRYRSDEEYAEHFRSLFADAVRARLRSVAPVGVLLSGGTDSGSVAAMAGWLLAREPGVSVPELRAYSFAFDELRECDERHISGPLAEHFGIPVTDVPADDAWPLRDFPDNPTHEDGPFVFGHHTLLERSFARARTEGMGLMMSGDRGDLVAGMSIYDLPSLFRSGRWPTLLHELRLLARYRGASLASQVRDELLRPARKAVLPPGSPLARLPLLRRLANPATPGVPDWVPPDFARATGLGGLLADFSTHEAGPSRRLSARQRYAAIFAPMHMTGVTTSERMHARHGQAFADPWSARPLAEFALAVPPRVLNVVGTPKRLTRLAMKGVMPEPSLQALRKIVPTPLFRRGLRERALDAIHELLGESLAERRGYLRVDRLLAYAPDERAGLDADTALWAGLTLELWLRRVTGRP
jgi:asparagine synthase (glutamine-hydrolysing)